MRMNKKTIISICLCIAACFMAVGYSILMTDLKIIGGANITSTWDVRITGILSVKTEGSAYNLEEPTFTQNTAKFKVVLINPGDTMTYKVTIKNQGTLTAVLNSMNITTSGSDAIIYEVSGIKDGDTLEAGQSIVVNVEAKYNPNVIADPEESMKTLKVGLEWIQYTNQQIPNKTYLVNYDANGGSGTMEGTVCSVGQDCVLTENTFTNNGAAFVGWATSPTGVPVYSNKQSVMNLTSGGKSITLYAVWDDSFVAHILANNQILSDSGIDFTKPSGTNNGKGLYYTSTNTQNGGTTYYFRGDIENNYVKFANRYWRIVRINEDGSIRLIYHGTSINYYDGNITTSGFNSSNDDNAYVGYMYGLTGLTQELTAPICVTYNSSSQKAVNSTSTYATKEACENAGGVWATNAQEATHANIVNSTIKKSLDSWYVSNLKNYSSYLSTDTGFCNNRKTRTLDNGYGTLSTTYAATYRLPAVKLGDPQFVCPQTNDLFTVSTSNIGNKALTYPIGLITGDEVIYAGGSNAESNYNYYLYSSSWYWTMTPDWYANVSDGVGDVGAYLWRVGGNSYLVSNYRVHGDGGVRPVINLKSTVKSTLNGTGEAGTKTNPYVIVTN